MMTEFRLASRAKMAEYRKNFLKMFLMTRQKKIRNDINKEFQDKKLEKDTV